MENKTPSTKKKKPHQLARPLATSRLAEPGKSRAVSRTTPDARELEEKPLTLADFIEDDRELTQMRTHGVNRG